jgi:porphyrinogen peroxidase
VRRGGTTLLGLARLNPGQDGGVSGERVPIDAQSVDAPLSRSAVFLVVGVADGATGERAARDVLAGLDDLVKTVGFRDLGGRLSCVAAVGSRLWDRLSPEVRPAELHEFVPLRGAHTAPATPGDLLFHIRAERHDLCFELERMILGTLGESATVIDETVGFRYFDARDLLGFVDGTANPTHGDLDDTALVASDDDPEFAGGSYVVVQKYLHDIDAWNGLSTEQQERIIGRTKVDNVELDDDAVRPAHKTLTTIEDADGEHDILRDNMPFGRPGQGEFGTYFIGYSGRLWVTERMLQRMFLGDPPGTYDRILDFSTAVTGSVFFAPTRAQLDALGDGPLVPSDAGGAGEQRAPDPAPADGSLNIGSLRPEGSS